MISGPRILVVAISSVACFAAFMVIAGVSGLVSPAWRGEGVISLVFGAIVLCVTSIALCAVIAAISRTASSLPSAWILAAVGALQGVLFHPAQILTSRAVTETAFWAKLNPDVQIWLGLAISALLSAIVTIGLTFAFVQNVRLKQP
jgi:hypothetical protein